MSLVTVCALEARDLVDPASGAPLPETVLFDGSDGVYLAKDADAAERVARFGHVFADAADSLDHLIAEAAQHVATMGSPALVLLYPFAQPSAEAPPPAVRCAVARFLEAFATTDCCVSVEHIVAGQLRDTLPRAAGVGAAASPAASGASSSQLLPAAPAPRVRIAARGVDRAMAAMSLGQRRVAASRGHAIYTIEPRAANSNPAQQLVVVVLGPAEAVPRTAQEAPPGADGLARPHADFVRLQAQQRYVNASVATLGRALDWCGRPGARAAALAALWGTCPLLARVREVLVDGGGTLLAVAHVASQQPAPAAARALALFAPLHGRAALLAGTATAADTVTTLRQQLAAVEAALANALEARRVAEAQRLAASPEAEPSAAVAALAAQLQQLLEENEALRHVAAAHDAEFAAAQPTLGVAAALPGRSPSPTVSHVAHGGATSSRPRAASHASADDGPAFSIVSARSFASHATRSRAATARSADALALAPAFVGADSLQHQPQPSHEPTPAPPAVAAALAEPPSSSDDDDTGSDTLTVSSTRFEAGDSTASSSSSSEAGSGGVPRRGMTLADALSPVSPMFRHVVTLPASLHQKQQQQQQRRRRCTRHVVLRWDAAQRERSYARFVRKVAEAQRLEADRQRRVARAAAAANGDGSDGGWGQQQKRQSVVPVCTLEDVGKFVTALLEISARPGGAARALLTNGGGGVVPRIAVPPPPFAFADAGEQSGGADDDDAAAALDAKLRAAAGGGLWSNTHHVVARAMNPLLLAAVPRVASVAVDGACVEGERLRARGELSGGGATLAASRLRWFAAGADGSARAEVATLRAEGVLEYTLGAADVGQLLLFEVVPRAPPTSGGGGGGASGAAVVARGATVVQPRAPAATGLRIVDAATEQPLPPCVELAPAAMMATAFEVAYDVAGGGLEGATRVVWAASRDGAAFATVLQRGVAPAARTLDAGAALLLRSPAAVAHCYLRAEVAVARASEGARGTAQATPLVYVSDTASDAEAQIAALVRGAANIACTVVAAATAAAATTAAHDDAKSDGGASSARRRRSRGGDSAAGAATLSLRRGHGVVLELTSGDAPLFVAAWSDQPRLEAAVVGGGSATDALLVAENSGDGASAAAAAAAANAATARRVVALSFRSVAERTTTVLLLHVLAACDGDAVCRALLGRSRDSLMRRATSAGICDPAVIAELEAHARGVLSDVAATRPGCPHPSPLAFLAAANL